MNFDEAVQRYETFLRLERNLAPRTIKAYLYELARMRESLGTSPEEVGLQDLETDVIRGHLLRLQGDTPLSGATTARTISALKGFFAFCVDQGYLETNPTLVIRSPKRPRRLPIYLIQDEATRLLSDAPGEEWMQMRDRAILTSLLLTGIRLQELVMIDLPSISFEAKTLRVVGKGRKERLIPLNDLVIQRLREYLAIRPSSKSKALFLNKFRNRLSGRSVERMVRQAVIRAGIQQSKITPHKLRHTFATLLHMNEVDIIEIQALLGHANISSTQIYTHTNPRRLRSAVDKLSGLADES